MSYTHIHILVYEQFLFGLTDEAADREASEMLTGNAQNLMQAVSEVCVYMHACAHVHVCARVCLSVGLSVYVCLCVFVCLCVLVNFSIITHSNGVKYS